MTTRFYDDYSTLKQAASDIASEVVLRGESSGWCSRRIEDLEEVKELLRPFRIVYTDDMHGTWESRGSWES